MQKSKILFIISLVITIIAFGFCLFNVSYIGSIHRLIFWIDPLIFFTLAPLGLLTNICGMIVAKIYKEDNKLGNLVFYIYLAFFVIYLIIRLLRIYFNAPVDVEINFPSQLA